MEKREETLKVRSVLRNRVRVTRTTRSQTLVATYVVDDLVAVGKADEIKNMIGMPWCREQFDTEVI